MKMLRNSILEFWSTLETFETQIQEFLRTLSLTPLPLDSYKKKMSVCKSKFLQGKYI